MNDYPNGDNLGLGQPEPAAPALPQGWKFGVSHGDGRVWLTINTPHGASATLSAADASEGAGPTIAAQVLDYLRDTLAAAPTPPAALDPQAVRDDMCRVAMVTLLNDIRDELGINTPEAYETSILSAIRALKSTNGGDAK